MIVVDWWDEADTEDKLKILIQRTGGQRKEGNEEEEKQQQQHQYHACIHSILLIRIIGTLHSYAVQKACKGIVSRPKIILWFLRYIVQLVKVKTWRHHLHQTKHDNIKRVRVTFVKKWALSCQKHRTLYSKEQKLK